MSQNAFWKPSSNDDDNLIDENDATGNTIHYPLNYSFERQILPITAHRTQILYALETYGVIVLVGETGCGKSTQLPQYFYENGWSDDGDSSDSGPDSFYREIICTQPRRIAAITLAKRLSQELNSSELIGHSVRFSSTYVPGTTKIRFVTDGYLLREMIFVDPLMKHCSVLIIDEAHERSMNTELLLGVVKKIRRVRPELRVVVCSATLDAEGFLEYFVGSKKKRKRLRDEKETKKNEEQGKQEIAQPSEPSAKKRKSRWGRVEGSTSQMNTDTFDKPSQTPTNNTKTGEHRDQNDGGKSLNEGTIISVDGRQHPVDILYIQEPVADYVKSAVEIALRIHQQERDDGDILCFLTTGEEIDEAVERAENILAETQHKSNKKSAVFLPLYSGLPPNVQSQPFLPQSSHEIKNKTRRVIFATNIAETSVTVPNIAHVIDCGFAKMPFFDPHSGFDRLIVCPISQASAKQRAGRAGRVRSGKCYRLYSEKDFWEQMEESTTPEIQRSSLTTLIMTIKALGVKNVLSFELMSVPSLEALSHGLESLYALGAIGDDTELTELGKEMVYFPTEPRVSRMLLGSLDMESRDETPSMIQKLIVGDVLTVAAALQVRSLMYQPRTDRQWRVYDDAMADILDRSGDHVTMVHLFDLIDHSNKMLTEDECRERFVNRVALQRALDVRNQLTRFLSRRFGGAMSSNWLGSRRQEIVGSQVFDQQERSEFIRKCVCAGFFMNVAKLGSDGSYYTLRGKYAVSISPTSVLQRYGESASYILFGETYDGNRGGVDVRPCSSISGLWLRELAPHYWK